MAAVVFATSAGIVRQRAADDADDATYIQAAIEAVRADIAVAPGSGIIRGGFLLEGVNHCFRDNAGGTAGLLYAESDEGWVEQDLGAALAFTLGTDEFVEGATLEGATSGATGTVGRVVLDSGDWPTNDAAGTVYLYGVSGNFAAESISDDAGGAATASGAQVATTLSAGGRYDVVVENFFGQQLTRRAYFVNGVDLTAFEWDGNILVPLDPGSVTIAPTHIAAHKNRLFLSVASSALHSQAGDPYEWVTGAGEIATGATITGYVSMPGGVLGIFAADQSSILYGSGPSDWDLRRHSSVTGATEWTLQRVIGSPIFHDQEALWSSSASQDFGDFNTIPLSDRIKPVLERTAGQPQASLVSHRKGHYRIYFTEGTTSFSVTMGVSRNGVTGFLRQAFPLIVYTTWFGEDADGNELLFFGSDDGYVYQLDAGTSFDGAAIESFLRFAFNHCGSPDRRKRFYKVELELDAPSQITLYGTPEYDYASSKIPQGRQRAIGDDAGSLASQGGYWGSAVWGEFIWGNPVFALGWMRMSGSGRNIGLSLYSSEAYAAPHTIQGYQLQYITYGQRR